ncbi:MULTISPECIES: formimidoylglutamase [Sphingobacterium]|uniref:Formimidoylglutamase n=1 Tax=Sphingobacterium litopenaei TaxID=2763500 RepID=A0ABR7YED1_9SPHI|nr:MULTISPECIES: formimidoylglutamase [Sphingobacterium]MBD1429668.1 formimidoylglutamase [Sphingobacterium litopenaei]NGM73348.1 formimidoylglutamase [Sphingobacterium sp. SGL-16]
MDTFKNLYTKTDSSLWKGRIDGEQPGFQRWHQIVSCVDLNEVQSLDNAVVILGFCCDEGVRRNQGREGAKAAPDYLRKILANLPVHFIPEIALVDAGNINTNGYDLESAQEALVMAVQKIRTLGGKPLLIGGGHEITYGHFKGLHQPNRKTGIINLDAHLDMRPLLDGKGNSGTSFYQLNKELFDNGEKLKYLAIGIQEISNTKGLIDYAQTQGVEIINSNEIYAENLASIQNKIKHFADQVDELYLTIDMDAFSAAFAPGVSAVAYNGIIPDVTFYNMLDFIYQQPKLINLDIAELNPRFDLDERTARLAANLIFQYLQKF